LGLAQQMRQMLENKGCRNRDDQDG
jgi:hypothetical protein